MVIRCLYMMTAAFLWFIFSILSRHAATIDYTYDVMGRLIRAEYDNGTVIQYTYDLAGNRLHETVVVGSQSGAHLTVSKTGTGSGTVASNPPGINCGPTCEANFTKGAQVTLSAQADSGSTFAGWSGAGCSGTDPCTMTLAGDTSIAASFQTLGSCSYDLSPSSKTFSAKGGSVSVKVSATGQSCPAPSVTENADWVSLSGSPSWKGSSGTVKLAIQQNTSSLSRTDIVSISGKAFTVQQDGAACQLTALTPSSGKYPATGGIGSFDVTVNPPDCGWAVTTTSDWVHLDTTAGAGSGKAAFHIDANGTGKNRTGKIEVTANGGSKKKTFTVNESK